MVQAAETTGTWQHMMKDRGDYNTTLHCNFINMAETETKQIVQSNSLDELLSFLSRDFFMF